MGVIQAERKSNMFRTRYELAYKERDIFDFFFDNFVWFLTITVWSM